MRLTILTSLIALLLFNCKGRTVHTDSHPNPAIKSKLDSLLKRREYFALRDALSNYHDSLPTVNYNYFSAFVQNAFNQNVLSVKSINEILNSRPEVSDSLSAELLLLQRDNYIKLFAYKEAATCGKQVIEKYSHFFDQKKIDEIKNKNIIYEGLADTPPQKTFLQRNKVIPWERDRIGLMRVPVAFDKGKYDFIFDTRAGISVMMKSCADKMKLRMPGVHYKEGSGITGNTFDVELGIADSLMIGDIRVYNVVFQVLPDDKLSFPSMNYSMNGIIGFPEIVQLRNLRINHNGTITINDEVGNVSKGNLAFDEAAIVLHTSTVDGILSFYVDTGANESELFYNYFSENETRIKQMANIDTVEVGGAGGIQKKQVYTIPSFNLQVNDKKAELKNLQVLTKPTYRGQKYYGNLGQDLLSQFSEITLDFEHMSMSLK